ncbi:hypothetical protein [Agarivorans litoreus]|uniref:hypothetical protein n=1 Tax=Agarivorans litoreus TaxID=1510455 RepID=UPI001C7CB779|nr:hypothetical protein [Agarivorans litoreus]
MTLQAPDKIVFMGEEFSIERQLLTKEHIGLEPSGVCTALWRGFTALYKITQDHRLTLDSLSLFGVGSFAHNVASTNHFHTDYHNYVLDVGFYSLFTGVLRLRKHYLKVSSFAFTSTDDDYQTLIELSFVRGKVVDVNPIRVAFDSSTKTVLKTTKQLHRDFNCFQEAYEFAQTLWGSGVSGVKVRPHGARLFVVVADYDAEFKCLFGNRLEKRFCNACGEIIPIERVKLAPSSFMCVHCLSKLESEKGFERKLDNDGIGGKREEAIRTMHNKRNGL